MSPYDDRNAGLRVAAALRAALADHDYVKAGGHIVTYLDADMVLPVVQSPARLSEWRAVDRGDYNTVATALWATSRLGPGYMVTPHVLEVDESLYGAHRLSGSGAPKRGELEQYLTSPGMMELVELAKASATSIPSAVHLQQRLKEMSLPSYARFAILRHSWRATLRSLLDKDLVNLDRPGPTTSELLSHPKCDSLRAAFTEVPWRAERSINNLHDAIALIAIQSLTQEWGREQVELRFVSGTRAVHEVCELEQFRELTIQRSALPAKIADFWPLLDHPHSVLRSGTYLCLRAVLNALASESSLSAVRGENWNRVIERLELIQTTVENAPVSEALKEFSDLVAQLIEESFLLSLWMDKQSPAASVLEHGATFSDATRHQVWSQAQARRPALKEDIKFSVEMIHQIAEREQRTLGAFVGLADAAKSLPSVEKASEYIQSIRDLGLVRWMAVVPDEVVHDIEEFISRLASPRPDARLLACRELCERIVVAESVDGNSARVISGVLWFLRYFRGLADFLARWLEGKGASDDELGMQCWLFAARLRGGFGVASAHDLVRILLPTIVTKPPEAARHLYVALAYCEWLAWRELRFADPTSGKEHLKRALSHASRVASLSKADLVDAFALNYTVAAKTDLNLELSQSESVRWFSMSQANPQWWHLRFADTKAVYVAAQRRAAFDKMAADPNMDTALKAMRGFGFLTDIRQAIQEVQNAEINCAGLMRSAHLRALQAELEAYGKRAADAAVEGIADRDASGKSPQQ